MFYFSVHRATTGRPTTVDNCTSQGDNLYTCKVEDRRHGRFLELSSHATVANTILWLFAAAGFSFVYHMGTLPLVYSLRQWCMRELEKGQDVEAPKERFAV
jgi:hypothetical protein